MSSVAIAFVHAQKVVCFGFFGWIPMIQVPSLQYETGMKFFHRAVQSYTASKIRKFQYNHVAFSIFSRFYRMSDLLTIQE